MIKNIIIRTSKRKEIIDITDRINKALIKQDVEDGVCCVSALHIACAVATADVEPGTDFDFSEAVDVMFPKQDYKHPGIYDETENNSSQSIIGPSINLTFKKKQLVLGLWQRVILVELSGPRPRDLMIGVVN